jgi:hypothetical protein
MQPEPETNSAINIEYNNEKLVDFLTKKELCYYKMVDKFFKNCQSINIIKMIDIIDGKSNISLRVLDWFVTKYSKKGIDIQKDGELYDVHIIYKAQLKSYKKRYFDPFRRKKRFNYMYHIINPVSSQPEIHLLQTTIGQLNFFRWAISYDIINFVDTYLGQITKAMNVANKEINNKKKNKKSILDNINNKANQEGSSSDESDCDSESEHDFSKSNTDSDSDIIISRNKKAISLNKPVKNNTNNTDKDLILNFD